MGWRSAVWVWKDGAGLTENRDFFLSTAWFGDISPQPDGARVGVGGVGPAPACPWGCHLPVFPFLPLIPEQQPGRPGEGGAPPPGKLCGL